MNISDIPELTNFRPGAAILGQPRKMGHGLINYIDTKAKCNLKIFRSESSIENIKPSAFYKKMCFYYL
jgi:hypothetical protein